ncbi:MAG: hypothetical protein H7143_01455 [Pseudorhodobacter sp.]|nr:hypothetical protein [Rhizobacter sp.]
MNTYATQKSVALSVIYSFKNGKLEGIREFSGWRKKADLHAHANAHANAL